MLRQTDEAGQKVRPQPVQLVLPSFAKGLWGSNQDTSKMGRRNGITRFPIWNLVCFINSKGVRLIDSACCDRPDRNGAPIPPTLVLSPKIVKSSL